MCHFIVSISYRHLPHSDPNGAPSISECKAKGQMNCAEAVVISHSTPNPRPRVDECNSDFRQKSDCSLRLQRKTGEPRPYLPNSPFSTVRSVWENREIRAFSAYFGGRRADFLCGPDCVAERKT